MFLVLNTFNTKKENIVYTNPKPDLVIYNQDTLYYYADWKDQFLLYPLIHEGKYSSNFENQKDTTCWASYCFMAFTAVWEIDKGNLYLNEIRNCCSDEIIPLDSIFKKRKIRKERIKASWVSDEIIVSKNYYSLIQPWAYDEIY